MFADWADKYIGIPYKLHTNSMKECDCYGLVQLIYKNEYNIILPSYFDDYTEESTRDELADLFNTHEEDWCEIEVPQPGDAIYFQLNGHPKHIGVVLGNNLFIHNLFAGGSVTIGDYTNNKWKDRVLGFYRYGYSSI